MTCALCVNKAKVVSAPTYGFGGLKDERIDQRAILGTGNVAKLASQIAQDNVLLLNLELALFQRDCAR